MANNAKLFIGFLAATVIGNLIVRAGADGEHVQLTARIEQCEIRLNNQRADISALQRRTDHYWGPEHGRD